MNKIVLSIIVIFSLLAMSNCDDGDPGKDINLPVPFFNQEYPPWCGIACIQMWAHYDSVRPSQAAIAGFLQVTPYQKASPSQLLIGVGEYTGSEGYLATKARDIPGSQGDLIAATIEGVIEYTPSIMPFYGDHAILIKGHNWKMENERKVAIKTYYHDPDGGKDLEANASTLKVLFVAAPWEYWVVVGRPEFVPEGVESHDRFVLQGGTYYGGPLVYNPKGLTLDPSLY